MNPVVSDNLLEDLKEIFGDEWRPDLTPTQNVQIALKELRHFRKLMGTMSDFMLDVDEWLSEYEEEDFSAPGQESPRS